MNPKANQSISVREILAVVIALSALVGVFCMLNAEMQIIPGQLPFPEVLKGLQRYGYALGGLFLAVGVAFVILDRENDIDTSADEQE